MTYSYYYGLKIALNEICLKNINYVEKKNNRFKFFTYGMFFVAWRNFSGVVIMNITKTILAGLVTAGSVLALPTLQLDISDGMYDVSTQTTVNTSNQFGLIALLNSVDFSGDYYISMAVTPQISSPEVFGSFVFAGETITISDMHYGTPPVDNYSANNEENLAPHGIFPTYFKEFKFSFTGTTVSAYNAANQTEIDNGTIYSELFNVDMGNLNPNYGIHFDLYSVDFRNVYGQGKEKNTVVGIDAGIDEFAPFSHDAEAGYIAKDVPEPATLALFGLGLLALSGIRLVRRKK